MRPCRGGGGSHVARLTFKTSRVGVYKCLSLIVGFAVTVAIWPREVVSCRDFILRAVATFWAMSLVGIYPGRASFLVNLTPPPTSPYVFTEWSLGTRGNQDGAIWWRPCPTNFKWKHGFCQNAAWSFRSVTYYFLDHLNEIKRKYFLWNKKAYVLSDKALILHVHRELWS